MFEKNQLLETIYQTSRGIKDSLASGLGMQWGMPGLWWFGDDKPLGSSHPLPCAGMQG